MTIWVLNTSGDQVTVPIAHEGAPSVKIDSVFIQGKSKAKLEAGFVVETNFLARTPQIKVKEVNAAPAPQPAQGSNQQNQQQDRDSRRTQFKKSENNSNF